MGEILYITYLLFVFLVICAIAIIAWAAVAYFLYTIHPPLSAVFGVLSLCFLFAVDLVGD